MGLVVLHSNMSVQFVRLHLTFCDETSSTKVADEWLFSCVDSCVVFQLGFAAEWFWTELTWKRSHLHMCFQMVLPSRRITEGFSTLWTSVRSFITYFEVRSSYVTLQIARVCKFFLTVFTVKSGDFAGQIVCFHVISKNTSRNIELSTNLASKFQLFGVQLHVVG